MSDGVTGGAPAAAPAPTQGNAPANTAKPADPTPQPWTDKDDADLIERFRRSPHAKLKVDGKEHTISSLDDLQRLKLDAMRGRGSTRVVEESKREVAEAKKAREEAAAFADLVKRAQQGDKAARRELRLIPDDEAESERAAWNALPDEVKAIVIRNRELEQERAQRQEKDEEDKRAESQRKRDALKSEMLTKAKAFAKDILADLKEDNLDIELPEVIGAMQYLHGRKLKMGVDYGNEELKKLVLDRRERGLDQRMGAMKPEAVLRHATAALKALTPEQLQTMLGGELDALGKLLTNAYLAKHRASKAKPVQPAIPKREDPPARKPLSPFAYQR